MRLFGRKSTVDEVPAEVRDYYKSERRERAGVAWLLSAGTLLFTLVLAAALFFGGKWVYNRFINPDAKQEASQQANQQDQNNTGNETGTSSASTSTPNQPSDQKKQGSATPSTAGVAQTTGDGSETPVDGGRGAGPAPTSLVTTGPTE